MNPLYYVSNKVIANLYVGNNITCGYIVTCCRGTSVARSLKLLALPHFQSINQLTSSYQLAKTGWLRFWPIRIGIPGDTNTDQWLTSLLYHRTARFRQKRQSRAGVPYALIWNGSRRYCATLDLRKTSNRSVTEYWEIPSCVHYAEQPRLRRFGRVL
jgi:hypothetical protein